VAVGFHGAAAQLWQVSTGDRKGELKHEQHSGPVFSISFHPNGHLILTGGSDSFARMCNASTNEEVAPLRHDTGCWGTFSPDGSLVVTASTDHNARIWDVRTCTPRGPPLKHSGVVTAAVFSRDGRTVLTSSTDRTARLWDVATGKQLGPSMQHAGEVMRVGFEPDGAVLTSEEGVFPPSAPPSAARFWRVAPSPEGTDDQIELWAEVMTGMELDENGGARVLDVATWRERARRLRQSGFAFNEDPQDTVSTNSVLSE
jgi:WD40 repeat protein